MEAPRGSACGSVGRRKNVRGILRRDEVHDPVSFPKGRDDRVRAGSSRPASADKLYGRGKWRKMKGIARIELSDGTILEAELHWYEAHGIRKKEIKFKKPTDSR